MQRIATSGGRLRRPNGLMPEGLAPHLERDESDMWRTSWRMLEEKGISQEHIIGIQSCLLNRILRTCHEHV